MQVLKEEACGIRPRIGDQDRHRQTAEVVIPELLHGRAPGGDWRHRPQGHRPDDLVDRNQQAYV